MEKSRNRVTHSSSLAERLAAEAQRLREIARGASAGSKREDLLRRARQMERARDIDALRINSEGSPWRT
ncbi:hypothetical protein ABIC08_008613 [Bradyrhizobium sp. RT9b]